MKYINGANIQSPISQLQIVGAKISDQNVLYSLLLACHKYHCVNLIVCRRIFGRNVVGVYVNEIVGYCSLKLMKETIQN